MGYETMREPVGSLFLLQKSEREKNYIVPKEAVMNIWIVLIVILYVMDAVRRFGENVGIDHMSLRRYWYEGNTRLERRIQQGNENSGRER